MCFNSTWAATSQTRVQRMMKRKPRQRHRRPINWKYLSHFSHSLYNYRCQPSPLSSTVRWSRGGLRERWWCRPRTAPARGWSGSASTYCRYLRGQWLGQGRLLVVSWLSPPSMSIMLTSIESTIHPAIRVRLPRDISVWNSPITILQAISRLLLSPETESNTACSRVRPA